MHSLYFLIFILKDSLNFQTIPVNLKLFLKNNLIFCDYLFKFKINNLRKSHCCQLHFDFLGVYYQMDYYFKTSELCHYSKQIHLKSKFKEIMSAQNWSFLEFATNWIINPCFACLECWISYFVIQCYGWNVSGSNFT
jgi:hypothetical protein